MIGSNFSWRRRLIVPLLGAAAVALPIGMRSDGTLTAGEACAQTGTCVNSDDTCFVNGTAYPGYWQAGS